MLRLTVVLSLLLLGSLLRAADPASHLDDPGKLLAADAAWAKGLDAKLAAFERTADIRMLVQIHLKSPSAEEDQEPGAYMRALATKLGVIRGGVLVVYFADDPDWRVWIGYELAPRFAGRAGTVQELTDSDAIHDAKEALLKAMFENADAALAAELKSAPDGKAPTASRRLVALQAGALTDGLVARFAGE